MHLPLINPGKTQGGQPEVEGAFALLQHLLHVSGGPRDTCQYEENMTSCCLSKGGAVPSAPEGALTALEGLRVAESCSGAAALQENISLPDGHYVCE